VARASLNIDGESVWSARLGRLEPRDGGARQAFDGDTTCVGHRDRLASIKQQHGSAFDRQAGKARSSHSLDRAWADGRHIDA
jgi:hypothetical protein